MIAVEDNTALLVIVNTAEVAPAGIVTDAGTETSVGSDAEKDTIAPPAGAGDGRITEFPTEAFAPMMVVGDSTTVNEAAD